MENISQEAGKAALSTAEQLILSGREEGLQDAIKKLIKSGLLNLEQIAQVQELAPEYVQAIARQLKKSN